ncbi:MAG: PH domain-containing protein [Phycisphaerales bacterium]
MSERAASWVYTGVWAVLASWFRVPGSPPSLPSIAGEETRSFKPDLAFVRYQKFYFWLALGTIDVALTAAWIAACIASPILGAALFVPYLIIAVVPDIVAYVAIHLRYDTTWYVMNARSLRIRRGVWIIQETTVTFENVQNVDVRQGPVQRYFGISSLVIHTAGGGGGGEGKHRASLDAHVAMLEGITDAPSIRDQIMRRAAASRSAGLGDESARERATVSTAATGPSRMFIQALRDVRDAARAAASA